MNILGDSGSGLICQQKNGHFELIGEIAIISNIFLKHGVEFLMTWIFLWCVGITSFGMGCGDGSVGIYESVAHHAKWIDSVISSEKCSKNWEHERKKVWKMSSVVEVENSTQFYFLHGHEKCKASKPKQLLRENYMEIENFARFFANVSQIIGKRCRIKIMHFDCVCSA